MRCLQTTSHPDPRLVGRIPRVVRRFTRVQLVKLVESHHISLVLIMYGRNLTVTVPRTTTFRELKCMVVQCPSPVPLEYDEFHLQSRCHQYGGLDAEYNVLLPEDAMLERYVDCGDCGDCGDGTELYEGEELYDGAWVYCCRHLTPREQRMLVRERLVEMERMTQNDEFVWYDRTWCYRPPDSAYMI